MYKLKNSINELQSLYLDLVKQECSKLKPSRGELVRCVKCGASQTTLRKVGENRICVKCYKEQGNERD